MYPPDALLPRHMNRRYGRAASCPCSGLSRVAHLSFRHRVKFDILAFLAHLFIIGRLAEIRFLEGACCFDRSCLVLSLSLSLSLSSFSLDLFPLLIDLYYLCSCLLALFFMLPLLLLSSSFCVLSSFPLQHLVSTCCLLLFVIITTVRRTARHR